MHLGSEDAQQRFPRILQLVEKYSETQSQLIDKAARVPPWMFIGWINQMVAILDKAEGLSVVDVLIRIAKEYPQALCYPFKTSFPSFQFDKSDVGAKSYRAVEE
jgi:DNA-dependent protein kinase catalytic subunit